VGSKKLNILFITWGQYPNGGASSNRRLSYARGLIELGNSLHFLLLMPQNRTIYKEDIISYNGILLESLNLPEDRNRNPIQRRIQLFRVIRKAQQRIRILNATRKIDALVLLDAKIWLLDPFINTAKKEGIRIFHERTEYPFAWGAKSLGGRLNLLFYLRNTLQKFDGIYVISQALNSYFKSQTGGKLKVETIQMTVEPDRFTVNSGTPGYDFDYIAYCGLLYGNKDGVPILIESFALIAEKWPGLKLFLIGDHSDPIRLKPLKQVITSYHLEDRVIFTGRVSRNDIPVLLSGAKILALARPGNKQAEGGFPTKLGEYLATGNPVVVTRVGEIPDFLTDGRNAFIAEPDSPESFAGKLDEALSDYQRAKEIGKEGQKLTYNEFNYKVQAEKLERFIIEVNGS